MDSAKQVLESIRNDDCQPLSGWQKKARSIERGILMMKRHASILWLSVTSLLALASCGKQQESEPKDIINIQLGLFDRHSIVERDPGIKDDALKGSAEGLAYFPTTLPKVVDRVSRFGEDIFWTLAPGTFFSIQTDSEKILPDQLLLEVELPVGYAYPTGGFFHNEFKNLDGANEDWKVEFQPHVRVRSASSSEPVYLKVNELWVCSRIESDNTISVLQEQRRQFSSGAVTLRSTFQDIKLPFEVSKASYLNFKNSCDSLQGKQAYYLEFFLAGAESAARTLQFIELRVIKQQIF